MVNDTLKIDKSDIEMLESFVANASRIRYVMYDPDTDAKTCVAELSKLFKVQVLGELAMALFITKLKLMVEDE